MEMACDDCSPAECVDTHLRFKIRKNDEVKYNSHANLEEIEDV